MKFFGDGGWWLPDCEEHLQDWMLKMHQKAPGGRLGYQLHKYEKAKSFVKQFKTAVDIGGHVGLWSWPMAHDFEKVIAFEPVAAHRECWEQNMSGMDNAEVYPFAVGEQHGEAVVRQRTPDSSGDTGVELNPTDEEERVQMISLDDMNLESVDFIKLDCEGFEVFALKGAKETILRCRPVICVEQKPETGMEAKYGIGTTDGVEYLESLGMKRKGALQGDYFLAFD